MTEHLTTITVTVTLRTDYELNMNYELFQAAAFIQQALVKAAAAAVSDSRPDIEDILEGEPVIDVLVETETDSAR